MTKFGTEVFKSELKQSTFPGEQALQITASVPLKFKTLLQKIIVSASTLSKELALRGNSRENRLVNTILTSAWSLWAEVSSLIDIATLETEGLYLDLQQTAINTKIYEALERIISTLYHRQQTLTLRLAQKSPIVMADPLRLEQVLLTILATISENVPAGSEIYLLSAEKDNAVIIKIWGDIPIPIGETVKNPSHLCYPSKHDIAKTTFNQSIELALCKYLVKLHKGKMLLPGEAINNNAFTIILPSINH